MSDFAKAICDQFPNCIFSEKFVLKIEEFLKQTKFISSAQCMAFDKRLNGKINLENFKADISSINLYAEYMLQKYICKAILDIKKYLKSDVVKFDDIEFASKETHNEKRSILIFSANDKKLVYKPYNVKHLKVLLDIFNHIKQNLKYDISMFPEILHYEKDYCIIEFLDSDQNLDETRLCYCIGAALAFSYCFRITDLHSENILYANNSFYILDTKTCFYRDVYADHFALSYTGLLTTKNSCGLFDRTTKDMIVQINKDFEVSFLSDRRNRPKIINIKDNTHIVYRGFKDCYRAIMKHKDKILEIINSNDLILRFVFRLTSVYIKWMILLFTPSLNFKDNIIKLRNEMTKYKKGNISEENYQDIIKNELADMILTDVPYFYYDTTKNCIYHKDRLVVDNFYKENFSFFVKRWLDSINNKNFISLQKELNYLMALKR